MNKANAPFTSTRLQLGNRAHSPGLSAAATWEGLTAAVCVGLAMRAGESALEVDRFSAGLGAIVGMAAPAACPMLRGAPWNYFRSVIDLGLQPDEAVVARFPVFVGELDRDIVGDTAPLALSYWDRPRTMRVRTIDSLSSRAHPLGAIVLGNAGATAAILRGARDTIASREPLVLVRASTGGSSDRELLDALREIAPYEAVEPRSRSGLVGDGSGKALVFSTPIRWEALERAALVTDSLARGEYPESWSGTVEYYFRLDGAVQELQAASATKEIQPDEFVATDGLHFSEQSESGHRWRWGGARTRMSLCVEPEFPGKHRVELTIEASVDNSLENISFVAVNGRPTPFAISGSNPAFLSFVANLPETAVIQIGCDRVTGLSNESRALSLALGKTKITRLREGE